MKKAINSSRFVDLVIREAKPTLKQRALGNYRICSITRRGSQRYINLAVPAHMQQKILDAYRSGKQVRIFA